MIDVDIQKLKAKSAIQLFNWMEKRGVSSFSEELQRYYFFRQHFLFNENRIKNDAERLKRRLIKANNRQDAELIKADYHKMLEELKWIREGFFELSESDQKYLPKKMFFKSELLAL